MSTLGTQPKVRDLAVDALRTLAVLGMMATHTTRLIPLSERWAVHFRAMLFEPVIPALFLALAGASVVLSQASAASRAGYNPSGWLRRQLVRSLGLWAVSVVFYFAEDGWHWPDSLLAPGILATLGGIIALLSAVLTLGSRVKPAWRVAAIGVLLALGCAGYIALDRRGLSWFWLTAGNSPVLPLWLFALAGALYAGMGLHLRKSAPGLSILGPLLGCLGLGLIAFLVQRHGVEALFSKPLGRSDAARTFWVMRDGVEKAVTIGYYNLRPLLAALVASLLLAGYPLLRLAVPLLRPWAAWGLALGRHSLGVYILHLSLLAVLVLIGGKRPLPTAETGLAVYGILILACSLYAIWRERALAARRPVGIV